MICTSYKSQPKIPYQSKIINKIDKIYNLIHPDFKETKPILSGSFLIKLLVSPDADFGDYDFYFENKENLNNAKALLKEFKTKKISKNAFNYNIKNFDQPIQIISRNIGKPEQILKKHDFANSMICYQDGNIFYHKDFLICWKQKKLLIKNWQLPKEDTSFKWFYKVIVILNRINKYTTRYNLKLSNATLFELSSIRQHILNNESFQKFLFVPEGNLDYFERLSLLETYSITNYSQALNMLNRLLDENKMLR